MTETEKMNWLPDFNLQVILTGVFDGTETNHKYDYD